MSAPAVNETRTGIFGDGNQSVITNLNRCSQEMVSTLAGGIAHQFNNALMGITGSIELLKLGVPGGEGFDSHIVRIEASVKRMTDLTSQLLAYAQGGKYHPRQVSLNHLIDETLLQIKRQMNGHIEIEKDLQEPLERVMADENQMSMVISAVVKNAAEAIEENGRIRITTKSEQVGGHSRKEKKSLIHMMVEDNGRGMSEPVKQRVFEPFFSTKMNGRGLGMAAVHGIVLNHGGWITVDSDTEAGTTIHVVLPGVVEDDETRKNALTLTGLP